MSGNPPLPFPPRTWRCPDEARLATYFERRLPTPEQKEVEAHVSNCEHCLAQVAFLLEVQDAALPEVPRTLLDRVRQPAGQPSQLAALAWRWSPAVAALAGVAVVASVLVLREPPASQSQSEQPASREPASAPAASTQVMQAPAQPEAAALAQETRSHVPASLEPRVLQPKSGATVEANGLVLRWTAIPQALFYDVRISSPNGQLMWSSKAEQEEVRVPAEASLKPGSYFVWVRAHLPEGKLVRTQAVSFTVQE